ncbi:MAG: sigma 54-interacting transcriptional regulator [Novosphingobium sp.]|nr:sigma 54-interacting transcriptional regulator [Novosphingobium sp.]
MRVTYSDPLSETALGMLVAAMASKGEALAVDPESLSVFALAERIAKSDVPVLIGGPTGTGKEVLSRFIHAKSARADGPFVAVNCAAMPETMLEAMLFGHRKGAFTGANAESEGFMRAADGGTLLLDEIAEMPLPLQAKLLRALQEQEVVPIGSTTPVKVDVRIIACANRDLPYEVSEGRFRADLFYRLNVFPLMLTPLAQRRADIPVLTYALAMRHSEHEKSAPMIADEALAMLAAHAWPGNVRELENVIRRAMLLAHGAARIEAEHVVFDRPISLVGSAPPLAMTAASVDTDLASIVRQSEAEAIVQALAENGGNRLRTAAALGISERTLRYRLAAMRDAGIEIGRRAAGGAR